MPTLILGSVKFFAGYKIPTNKQITVKDEIQAQRRMHCKEMGEKVISIEMRI